MKLLGKKIASYIIDYVLIALLCGLYFFCADVFSLNAKTYNEAMMMLVCALITILLLTSYIPTKLHGQTVGQKIMKIRVVNKNGKQRTFIQSFLRECVVKITFAPIFVIFIAIYFVIFNLIVNRDPNSELPHDFILKTEIQAI